MKPFKTGRLSADAGLHLPGMMREKSQRQLQTNLGKAVAAEKRGPAKAMRIKGGLSQHTAPQKHEMTLFGSGGIGFQGPGSGEPV